MSIVIEDVRKILVDLGVHEGGTANEDLAQSILRSMFANGQTVATEDFVRKYLIDGGTVIPVDAPVEPVPPNVDPLSEVEEEIDPDHVVDGTT